MPDNTTLLPIYRFVGIISLCYPIYVICIKKTKEKDFVDKWSGFFLDVLVGLWLLVNTDVEGMIQKTLFIADDYKIIVINCIKWILSIGIYVDITFGSWYRMHRAQEKQDIIDYKKHRKILIETQVLALLALCLYILDNL